MRFQEFFRKFILVASLGFVSFLIFFGSPGNAAQKAELSPKYELNTGAVTVGGIEDRDGILWFATAIGPLRYDGENAKYLKTNSEIRLSRVGAMLESSDGRIWFGRISGGIVVHDKGQNSFRNYKHDPDDPESLSSNSLNWAPHLIAENSKGEIWIGTTHGLNKLKANGEGFVRYTHQPDDPNSLIGNDIHAVHIDTNDRIWVATSSGLSRYDPEMGRFTNYTHDPVNRFSLPSNNVSDIVEESDGVFWVSTHTAGLARLDVAQGTFESFRHSPHDSDSLSHDDIFSLAQDQEGNIWLGRSFSVAMGIEKFDPKMETFRTYLRHPDAVKPDVTETIMSVFPGADGTIWFPYNNGPVYRLTPHAPVRTVHFRQPAAQSRHLEPALIIAEDENSAVWIGGVGGLKFYDPRTGSYERWQPLSDGAGHETIGQNFNEINTILPAGENKLWIGEVDSTFLLVDTKTRRILQRFSSDVRAFGAWGGIFDPDDPSVIWFGSQTNGLGRLDTRDGTYRFFNRMSHPEAGIAASFVAKVMPAPTGGLWVATDGQGLMRFDGEKVVDQFDYIPGDPSSIGSSVVNDVEIDAQGRIWLATLEGGLNLLDEKNRTFQRFDINNGLPTNIIFGIEIDREGFLWLATNDGVFQFDPNLQQVIRRIGESDNLQTNILLTWPTGTLLTTKQELFLGALSGLSVISLPNLEAIESKPNVIFTALDQNGKALPVQSAVERVQQVDLFGPDSSFEFRGSVLGYISHLRKEIRYKLVGYDEDWNAPEGILYGRYTGLPEGSFTLVVQGSQGGGEWGSETRLRVNVYPAWWQTLWFKSATVLLVIGAVLGFAAWRWNILKKILETTKALAKSEEHMRDIAESAFDYFWETNEQHRIVSISDRFRIITGTEPDRFYGKTIWGATNENIDSPKWIKHRNDLEMLRPFKDFQFQVILPDEIVHHVLANGKPIFSESGKFSGYRGTGKDITAEVNATKDAATAQTRLLEAIESANASILVFNENDILVFLHLASSTELGAFRQANEIGMSFEEHVRKGLEANLFRLGNMTPDEFRKMRIDHHLDPTEPLELQLVNNTWLQLHETRMADGGTIQVWTDTSQIKIHEERAHRSQKMEAIGQLTGGVAHDFNNLLAVIQGNLELLEEEFAGQGGNFREYLGGALTASARGASLTHRLLAYARQQPLRPVVTDINELVGGMVSLLRRTLGERIHVIWKPGPGLWASNIDPGQLESAVLNLAVNARDAMPDGGTLTIETENVELSRSYAGDLEEFEPGDYVGISFTDTGVGMPKEVLDQIFEPFFTTKEVGKGTGLGLSMVYGFIKQSNGHINSRSEPGKGTSIRLFLARSDDRARSELSGGNRIESDNSEGIHILIVEDDHEVRKITTRKLQRLGYSVLEATDAQGAIKLLEGDFKIHLLLTDIGLPNGCDGIQLTQIVVQRWPKLPIVFMSGYPNVPPHFTREMQNTYRLLCKPFTNSVLIEAIDFALGNET